MDIVQGLQGNPSPIWVSGMHCTGRTPKILVSHLYFTSIFSLCSNFVCFFCWCCYRKYIIGSTIDALYDIDYIYFTIYERFHSIHELTVKLNVHIHTYINRNVINLSFQRTVDPIRCLQHCSKTHSIPRAEKIPHESRLFSFRFV